jgi:hypothetical protein
MNLWRRFIGWTQNLPDARDAASNSDFSTPMGGGSCNYNGPNLLQMGFSQAVAVLRSANLAPDVFATHIVPAQVDSPVNVLHVHVDWLLTGELDNLFFSYRVRRGLDATMQSGLDQKVLLHRHQYSSGGDPFERGSTVLLKSLAAGEAYENVAARVFVKVLSTSNASAIVSVCRYSQTADNCA